MNTRFLFLFGILLLPHVTGCRYYLRQPVTIHLRDAETQEPIPDVEVHADHLAMLDFGLIFLAPHVLVGKTDEKGEVTLYCDPMKDNLEFRLDAKEYVRDYWLRIRPERAKMVRRSRFSLQHDYYWDVYRNPSSRLNLKIPDQFRGVVLIQLAEQDTPPTVKGQRKFNYTVGVDGRVTLRERELLDNFETIKNITASRIDGTQLTCVEHRSTTRGTSDPIAFRLVTRVWKHHTYVCIVGTEVEAQELYESLLGDGKQDFNEVAFRKLLQPEK